VRRSDSVSSPVSERACPVARISSAMSEPSSVVETARRDPFGMERTRETSSRPRPSPTNRRSRSASVVPDPSMPGGTSPDASSAAFSSPR
jgi:hypothetical protein